MTRNRWILVACVVVVVVLAGLWYFKRGGEAPAVIDLVQKLPDAVKMPSGAGPDVFAVRDERIGTDTKRAIYAHPPTRIKWQVVVPNDAWLRTSLGVDPAAWDKEGDGVLFMIGIRVLDGGSYEQLLTEHVDPRTRNGDRRWVPVAIDLSAYGGRTVEIIFNTRTSLRGDDPRNDFAYWGAPAICLRP